MSSTQKISEIRTQIYLPSGLYRSVKNQAKARNISMAQLVRESLSAHLPPASKPTKPKTTRAKNDLMDLAGVIKGEPPDVAENISKYVGQLYEEKTR